MTEKRIKDAIAYNAGKKVPTKEQIVKLVEYFQLHEQLTVDGKLGPTSLKKLGNDQLTIVPMNPNNWASTNTITFVGQASPTVPPLVTGHPDPLLTNVLDIDHDGWLYGNGVERWPSVRHQKLATPHELPLGVMFHYTAVRPGADLWKRIQGYDQEKDRAASWNILIEEDGKIYQSVSLQRGSWHCRPVKKVRDGLKTYSPNSSLIGIELASLDGKHWPEAQIMSAKHFIAEIAEHYGVKRKHCEYLHMDFDPKRRSDAGLLWKKEVLPEILDSVYK